MNLNRDRTGASTCSPLTLGTVQLGVPYGVANRSGQPDVEHANKILAAAWDGGITCFDTASIYGSAERLLGEFSSNRSESRNLS